MDKNAIWKWSLLGAMVVWSLALVTPLDQKVKLGLDLKGGSSFVVEIDQDGVRKQLAEEADTTIDEITDGDVAKTVKESRETALEVIRNRIDNLGTTEPEIYPEGDMRIVVRLPGVDAETRAEAKDMLSRDAVLSFKLVHKQSAAWVSELMASGQVPTGYRQIQGFYIRDLDVAEPTTAQLKRFAPQKGAEFMLELDRASDGSTIYRPAYVATRRELGGDSVETAFVTYDQLNKPQISLELTKDGAKKFGNITEKYGPNGSMNADNPRGRQLAIILDNKLYSAPSINEPIYGGRAVISGSFSVQEARKQVNALRAGSLKAPIKIVEERTVAPTLGQDSIDSGIKAVIAGGVAVLLFMGWFYRMPGLIANASLLFVLLLLPVGMTVSAGFLGVLSGSLEGGAVGLPVLTLPGIAGIVLTIGMAVDANVLIFERMREEAALGKSVGASVEAGYNKAFSTILDANLTTLLTAAILFWQGSGPIRGFAVTLSAGILISMFIVLVITRLFFTTLAEKTEKLSLKMVSVLKKTSIDFVGKRKLAGIISISLIAITWIVFAGKGQSNFGVDFTGGTVVTFAFEEEQPIDEVRAAVEAAGFNSPGLAYQSNIGAAAENARILEVKISAWGEDAEPAIDAVKALPGNYSDIATNSIGSQIGEELKSKGIKAIIGALIMIIIYISIRFEFAFAMGAIVALAHDVLITVGIYCLLGRELNMPIIAALLTIVGYSVNDTIVVFDRIREDIKLMPGKSYKEIANISINQTLSRTLLTSVTTLLTVVMLMIFGGGSISDFAWALFIGIVVGTYSSVFVATPIVLLWHKEKKV